MSMNTKFDVVCFSHLRWKYVYQRPQHLLSRCAKEHRVFFVEEPISDTEQLYLDVQRHQGVWVIQPHIPPHAEEELIVLQQTLLSALFSEYTIEDYVLWYYTPMSLAFSNNLYPLATVYDCMDELTLFAGAPSTLQKYEQKLFQRADLVFTGGRSLYEAKRTQHTAVYEFPSSVDSHHFQRAQRDDEEPAVQESIPYPRIGFYGVLDERLDTSLLESVATLRPQWQFILIGPIAKIDPQSLPQRNNIHYLGPQAYENLPRFLGRWDVAIMPFARNEATRFISPTKTLEYLAAGKPVVSTSIRDVVEPYGLRGLVQIADTPEDFVSALESALNQDHEAQRPSIDAMLSKTSWDQTWQNMNTLITSVVKERQTMSTLPNPTLSLLRKQLSTSVKDHLTPSRPANTRQETA